MSTKETYIKEKISSLNMDQKIGALLTLGFNGTVVTSNIHDYVSKYHCGGLRLTPADRTFKSYIDPNTGENTLFVEALGPLWQETLSGLEEGDISEPREVTLLDGRRAYHIVRLEERIPEHKVSIETDYALIERRALQDKQDRVMREWMEQLKETVYIELRGRALRTTTAANTPNN